MVEVGALVRQRQLKWCRLFLCMNGDDGDTMDGVYSEIHTFKK